MREEQVTKFIDESVDKLSELGFEDMTLVQVYRMGMERGVKWSDLNPPEEYVKLITDAQDKMGIAVVALDRASNELGVSQPGYTAPVSNANQYIKEALIKIRNLDTSLAGEDAPKGL